jgi:sterol O-acyltransferase
MDENSLDTSEKVSDIKQKLEKVVLSLKKYETNTTNTSSKLIEDKMISIEEKASDLIEEKLSGVREEFTQKIISIISKFNNELQQNTENFRSQFKGSQKSQASKMFIEKVHRKQSAPISKLLYSRDFQTVYNIFLAILVNIGIAELVRDILDPVGMELFIGNFSKLDVVFKIWVPMFVWSYTTTILVQQHSLNLYTKIIIHILTILLLGYNAVAVMVSKDLPIASSFIVLCEMVRFPMKMHSYFREKLLHGNGENSYSKFIPEYLKGLDPPAIQLPQINILNWSQEVQRYTYYLFTPTLIYRDSYPKLDRSIRWKNLSIHLFNFFGAIIYTALIFKAFCVPEFQSASKNIRNTQAVILSWFRAMLPGTMVFLLLFFAVMHSWFSIWAEVLNFADRKFYDDWWSAKDFGTFYRKISVIVYEWLHTYVFLDLQRFSRGVVGTFSARLIVFLLSGLITELIIDLALGFFFPYIFIIIAGPGSFMITMNNKGSRFYNVIVWVLLIIMMGLIMMLYSLEYYYRLDQVDKRDFQKYGTLAYFIPQWVYQLSINN